MNNTERIILNGASSKIELAETYIDQVINSLEEVRELFTEKIDNLSEYPQFESKIEDLQYEYDEITNILDQLNDIQDNLDLTTSDIKVLIS